MILLLKEIQQGRNTFEHAISREDLTVMLREVDGLYEARDGVKSSINIDRVGDLLQVRAEFDLPIAFECARCLKRTEQVKELDIDWTLLPVNSLNTNRLSDDEEVELSADDLDVSYFRNDEIKLGELVREAVLLEMDACPRCELDACEFDLYGAAPTDQPDEAPLDPRWAALAEIKDKMKRS